MTVKMMVLSAEDLIAKEEHYDATFYCSYTSVNYNKDNDDARIQEDADQDAFKFVKQHLKQLYQKPDIIFLTTISNLYAEKLEDNQAEDVTVSYLQKTLRRKVMTHLTGFNYTKMNRLCVVYSESLEIDDVIHKHVQLEKEFDAVIKCNE